MRHAGFYGSSPAVSNVTVTVTTVPGSRHVGVQSAHCVSGHWIVFRASFWRWWIGSVDVLAEFRRKME
jgi:hypothetical protein